MQYAINWSITEVAPHGIWFLGAIAAQLLGATIGAITQRRAEKRQKKQSDAEYERALEDDRANYDRDRNNYLSDRQHQEDYNSPINQRKRLEEAGLNPALIYGSATGAMGETSGPQNASGPSAPSSKGINAQREIDPSDIDPAEIAQLALAQENQRMNKQQMEAQQQLISAQVMKTLAETDKKQLDTQLMRDTYDAIVANTYGANVEQSADIELKHQQKRESEQRVMESDARIKKIIADTNFTINQDRRNELMATLERGKVTKETELIVKKILTEEKNSLMKLEQSANTVEERERIKKQALLLQSEIDYMDWQRAQDWVRVLGGVKR